MAHIKDVIIKKIWLNSGIRMSTETFRIQDLGGYPTYSNETVLAQTVWEKDPVNFCSEPVFVVHQKMRQVAL